MNDKPVISIVSPVYKAGNIIPELVRRIGEEVAAVDPGYEIILVEDGSPDHSWTAIEAACAVNKQVKGVKLSRNYGQHYAITAGIALAKGDYVVVMDCDLQDNPKYIRDMYALAQQGNDVVFTVKKKREHSSFKNITARLFFWVFNMLTENKKYATGGVGAFSMLSRKAADAYNRISDYHRHYLMLVRLLGFQSAYLDIVHEKRFEGKSSYNLRKLINHAVDGITSQSVRLLKLSIGIGFFFVFLSLLGVVYLVINYITRGALQGYTSLMVMLLLSTGLILMSIGIMGIYIGKIFEQVKNRPLYLVDKTINM